MVLILHRTYFPGGTNGKLETAGQFICNTIELPWHNNLKMLSCIPEGKYFLHKRFSSKFSWHIEILDVPNRSSILFHPANNARKELNGCIAPVTKISGAGLGLMSRKAFRKLKKLVFESLDRHEETILIIQS